MRHLFLAGCVLAIGLMACSAAVAQKCGDVSGDNRIDLSDLVYLEQYLMQGNPPLSPSMDIDGWAGVALGDFVEMTNYLFVEFIADSFDCTPDFTYSFAPSPNDTIFLPRILNIPSEVRTVTVPIITSFRARTGGMLLFLRPAGNSLTPSEILSVSFPGDGVNGSGEFRGQDHNYPEMHMFRDRPGDSLAGTHMFFKLVYQDAGGGAIGMEPYDITNLVRTCIERDGDLVIPTIAYVDYALPPDTLTVSPTSLTFTAQSGREINDTLELVFTSSGTSITLDLSSTQPWLTVANGTTFTTPASVKVTVNARALAMGLFPGDLNINSETSVVGVNVPQRTIPTVLTAGPPVSIPPGDVSCDGVLDLVDLSMIIARVLGTIPQIKPCY